MNSLEWERMAEDRDKWRRLIHTHVRMVLCIIYIYIYMCVCVYVYVYIYICMDFCLINGDTLMLLMGTNMAAPVKVRRSTS